MKIGDDLFCTRYISKSEASALVLFLFVQEFRKIWEVGGVCEGANGLNICQQMSLHVSRSQYLLLSAN